MNKGLFFLAAGSTMAMAAPAFAQDNTTFTGPRAEVLVGYDQTSAGSETDANAEGNDQSIEGVAYGAGVGYDFAAGGVVLGVEAEYLDSSAEVEFDDPDTESFGLGSVSAGRDIYVGARVGFLASPRTLIYAKGGYTNASYEGQALDEMTERNYNIDTDGFRIGAGAEFAISENAYIKAEYRYSNYSEGEVDFDNVDVETNDFSVDLDRHQVMAGVGFRF